MQKKHWINQTNPTLFSANKTEEFIHNLCSYNSPTCFFFVLFHQKHQYILKPTSAQAKMKRNASALPLRSRQMPRFVVDVHVEKIPLSLEETQYKMLIALMDGFERHFRQRRYLKWRPKSPIMKK